MRHELKLEILKLALSMRLDAPLVETLALADELVKWVEKDAEPNEHRMISTLPGESYIPLTAPANVDITAMPDHPDDPWRSDERCVCGHLLSVHMGIPKTCGGILGKGTCGCQDPVRSEA